MSSTTGWVGSDGAAVARLDLRKWALIAGAMAGCCDNRQTSSRQWSEATCAKGLPACGGARRRMMLGLTIEVLGVLMALVGASAAGAETVTQTFPYTGTQETFTVPAGVTSLAVTAIGGKGGTPELPELEHPTKEEGIGATVTANLAVNPGDVLDLIVAGDGADGHCDDVCPTPGPAAGGFGGGGESPKGSEYTGSGGGGATSVTDSTTASLLLVAGGGGGSGSRFGLAAGGAAGSAGQNSVCEGYSSPFHILEGGGAGTSVAGGMGGISPAPCGASASGGDGQSFF